MPSRRNRCRCLSLELAKAGLAHAREVEQTIYYEGIDVGARRADFIVESLVIVELKAVINLEDVHLAQRFSECQPYHF